MSGSKVTLVALVLMVGAVSAARGQDVQCAPGLLGCTPFNALGAVGAYDGSVTDLAYRPALGEIWAVEQLPGFQNVSSRVTAYGSDLKSAGRRSFNLNFGQQIVAIAEVPPGHAEAGNCYVLAPEDNLGGQGVIPQMGIMNNAGSLIPGAGAFKTVTDPATGEPPPAYFVAMDAREGSNEIVLLDAGYLTNVPALYFVDPTFEIARGPFALPGVTNFYGGGVAYNSDSTVLVTFENEHRFRTRLALEFTLDGRYTGRSVILDDLGTGAPANALALETGAVGALPALFLYDVITDAAYALPLDASSFQASPGLVLELSPVCEVLPDGRVRLAWTNDATQEYDGIRILQDTVQIAALPPNAQEFTTRGPIGGKYKFCVETRLVSGEPNQIRACCEGQNTTPLPFRNALAVQRDIDSDPRFIWEMLGVDALPGIQSHDEFRLYLLNVYDNRISVMDYQGDVLPAEMIVTQPPRFFVSQPQDVPAFGIAIINVTIGDQSVPMYALLDSDGPGNGIPRASVHFLKETTLPGAPVASPAGARYGPEMTLNIQAAQGAGHFYLEWDADSAGDLITLDAEQGALAKFRYDTVAKTVTLLAQAPLPLKDLGASPQDFYPLGGVSVLPSGHYMVVGGTSTDTTAVRAYLLTPFVGDDPQNPDLTRSVQFVGAVDGLYDFSQLLPFNLFGLGNGPDYGYSLDTVYVPQDEVGALFYPLPHYGPAPRRTFAGNFVVGLASTLVHPNLEAEPIFNETVTIVAQGSFTTDALTPALANRVKDIFYHVHVVSGSPSNDALLALSTTLDDAPAEALSEADLVIPGSRSLYRASGARTEKTIRVQIQNKANFPIDLRLVIGATGIGTGKPIEPTFRRSDVDDNSVIELTDAIALLNYQFLGGPEPRCQDAADVDDNGVIELTDAIAILNYLFLAGVTPAPPGPVTCGVDPKADELPNCVSESCK